MGVGIHGEPGHSREAYCDADAIIGRLCDTIIRDLPRHGRDNALLFVNGLGGTPPAELYLAYAIARRLFEASGIHVARSLVGTYVTSLDMAGLSVTLALLDENELRLWDLPVMTAALRWGC